uniref:Putative lectin/glucanase superfamily protein n=1 Tax=viral metagenome TaxID=1070528 RepID=A0A6M3J6B3_9ZZZZ
MSIIQQKIASGTLMGWWDFRSGTIDDFSGNSVDGSFATGTYLNKEGLNLDGVDDYITAGTGLNVADDATWTGWIKTTDTNGVIFSKWDAGIAKRSWALLLSTGRLSVAVSSTGSNSEQQNDNSGALINDGIWHHVAVVYDKSANTVDFYVDGIFNEQDNLTTATGGINSDVAPVLVGDEYSGSIGGFFGGTLQELEIFTEKLTATEIAQLMGETADTNWPTKPKSKTVELNYLQQSSGLTSHWKMQPQANTIPDLTGAGNDASIVGSPAFVNTILGPGAKLTDSTNGFNTGSDWIGTSALTFGCWINLDDWGALNVGRIFDNSKAALKVTTANDTLTFTSDGYVTEVEAATNAITLNNFIFVCVTRTAGGVTNFYVNGALSGSADQDSGTPAGGTNVFMGNNVNGNRGLEGTMIEPFAIVGTVETAAQIAARYKLGAKLVQYKTDWGTSVSAANVTAGQLEDTDWQVSTGTWKVSTDTINGQKCKVLECIAAGMAYIPIDSFMTTSDSSYGTWEFWMYKGADANFTIMELMANEVLTPGAAGQTGYYLQYSSTEAVRLGRMNTVGSVTTLTGTADSYIDISTWYGIKIERTYNGFFTTYIKGGAYADWTAITGTNPVEDTTHTSAKYIVLDFDNGDKIAYSDRTGNYSITKYLGVI